MKKMAKDIFSFKKGDIITRVENANLKSKKYNENLGMEMETLIFEDNSYRGVPLEFVAVENSVCYLKGVTGFFNNLNINFELGNGWEEGWDYYIEVENEIREAKKIKNILEKKFLDVDAAISHKPYSFKSVLNLFFVKKYQIIFQENIIDTKWFFSKKSIESYVYILNGAFMAGTLYSLFSELKNK
jgi:hypothetical protein